MNRVPVVGSGETSVRVSTLRRPLAALAAVAILLLAAPTSPRAEAADDDLVVEGPHVIVRSTLHRKATLEACRDAIEAAIPIYEKSLPYRMPAGEKLELRLCRDADEYRDVVKELKLEAFATNLAVTCWNPLSSIISLQPRAEEGYLAAVGDLPELTRQLVCHEGVHQWLRRAKAQSVDWWPDWWTEGTAEWIAERCLRARDEARTPICVDDAIHRVASRRVRNDVVPLRLLLHADAGSFAPRSVLYDSFADLIRRLATDPARFAALSTKLRDLPPPPLGSRAERGVALARAFESTLVSIYGSLAEIERKPDAPSRPARWFEEGRAFDLRGDEIVGAAFAASNAALLSADVPSGAPFDLTGDIWFGGGVTNQLDVVIGYERRDDPRWLKIALGRAGYVTLLAYAYGNWQTRYTKNVDIDTTSFPEATWIPIRVRVDAGHLELSIGGSKAFEADVPPGFDVLHGAWGFGGRDTWGKFRGWKVVPRGK